MILAPLPPHPIPLFTTMTVVVAASTDLSARRVPNWLIASGLVTSLAVQIWLNGPTEGGAHWILGALTGFALFFPIYSLGGMAAGDVKLLMVVGAWMGPLAAFSVALNASLCAGVWAIGHALAKGNLQRLLANVARVFKAILHGNLAQARPDHAEGGSLGTIPYAVAIAAGTLAVLSSAA